MSVASSFGNLQHRMVAFPSVAAGDEIDVDTHIPLTATILFTSLPIIDSDVDVGGGASWSVLIKQSLTTNTYILVVSNVVGEDLFGVVNVWYNE